MPSFIDIIVRGGPLMIPIALCSVVSLAIILERLIRLRRVRKANEAFLERIRGNIRVGRVQDALAICQASDAPLAMIFAAGLNSRMAGMATVERR